MGLRMDGGGQGNPAPEQTQQSTSTPAPEQTQQSTSTPTPDSATQTAPPTGGDPAAPAVPAWTPNFKFKVMDKEHEIDEFVRGAIKDQDTEKKVKELYEKAYGLDVVKPRFQETRERFKQLNEAHTSVMAGIQELRETYSRGDFDSFFKKLNIPQEKVLQWIIDKAQYNELPPEQRQVLDARKNAEQEAWDLRKQNQTLEQQYEEAATQARERALQVELVRPDIKAFSEAFDAKGFKNREGKPVSFLDAVIETGEYAWYASQGKVDLSPEQAIQEVMARWGAAVQPAQAQPKADPQLIPVNGAAGGQGAPASQTPRATSTIPNVAGRQTSSVAKSKPKSIEDLKKLAATMGG